jgi:hypothetical protein
MKNEVIVKHARISLNKFADTYKEEINQHALLQFR